MAAEPAGQDASFDRRAFLKRMAVTGFAIPVIASFSMLGAGPAFGAPGSDVAGASNTTTPGNPGNPGAEVVVNDPDTVVFLPDQAPNDFPPRPSHL